MGAVSSSSRVLEAAGDDRVLALITFHGTERESGDEVDQPVRAPRDLPRRRGRPHRRLRRLGRGARGRRAAAERVLQHVSIEVAARARSRPWSRSGGCSGSSAVESPEALGGYVTWLEREGTQIHLIHTEDGDRAGARPRRGRRRRLRRDASQRVADAGHEVAETRAALGRAARVRDRARRPPGRADGLPAAGRRLTRCRASRPSASRRSRRPRSSSTPRRPWTRRASCGGGGRRRGPAGGPAGDLRPPLSVERLGPRRRVVRGLGRALAAALGELGGRPRPADRADRGALPRARPALRGRGERARVRPARLALQRDADLRARRPAAQAPQADADDAGADLPRGRRRPRPRRDRDAAGTDRRADLLGEPDAARPLRRVSRRSAAVGGPDGRRQREPGSSRCGTSRSRPAPT